MLINLCVIKQCDDESSVGDVRSSMSPTTANSLITVTNATVSSVDDAKTQSSAVTAEVPPPSEGGNSGSLSNIAPASTKRQKEILLPLDISPFLR